MEVRFNTNNYAQPSFGMAKLTKKGAEVAKQFLGDIPKLADGGALTVKNMTPDVIRAAKNSKASEASEIVGDFFERGTSNFGIDNAAFVKKQILPAKSYHTLKSFLKAQCKEATPKKGGMDTTKQTALGKQVVGNLVEIFDKNIANDNLSRKQCQKVLKLAEPYMEASDVAPRIAVTSSKLYAK